MSVLEPSVRSIVQVAELQQQGLVRRLGMSNVTAAQVEEARAIAPVVGVQPVQTSRTAMTTRSSTTLRERESPMCRSSRLAASVRCSPQRLSDVATRLGATPMQVALAWLLQRAPNILLIPGTSSPHHLRENLAAADLALSPEALDQLN